MSRKDYSVCNLMRTSSPFQLDFFSGVSRCLLDRTRKGSGIIKRISSNHQKKALPKYRSGCQGLGKSFFKANGAPQSGLDVSPQTAIPHRANKNIVSAVVNNADLRSTLRQPGGS